MAIGLLRGIDGPDVEFGLRSMQGDIRSYARLLRLFQMKHARDGEEIQGILRSGDLSDVRKAAHALKGASGTLGMKELQRLAGSLEQAATASEADSVIAACAEKLFGELNRVMAKLTIILPADSRAGSPARGGGQYRADGRAARPPGGRVGAERHVRHPTF